MRGLPIARGSKLRLQGARWAARILCDARSGYGGQPRRIAFRIRRTHVTISRSKSYAARRPPQAVTSLRNNETQGATSGGCAGYLPKRRVGSAARKILAGLFVFSMGTRAFLRR